MSDKQRCRWCQKLVSDKPVIGTLHICLSPEERRIAEYNFQMGQWQLRMQKLAINGGIYAPAQSASAASSDN